jgi:Phosphate-selective porin O and P
MSSRPSNSVSLALLALFMASYPVPAWSQSATPAVAGKSQSTTAAEVEAITFTPGLRVQARYLYDGIDANNDFYIARMRFKATGNVYGVAKYYAQIKLDNVGRFGREASAQLEDAWLEFPVMPELGVRAGLFDAPLSRNSLTSDSKLLLMDRSLIKDALTALGLADNTIGVLIHGRPAGHRFEYSAGIFDDVQFDQATSPTARQADGPMPMGRMVFYLLDPAPPGGYGDYQGSYIGQGRRLAIGLNAGLLPNARVGDDKFDLYTWGGDLFFNSGPTTVEAEFDRFGENYDVGSPSLRGQGWYVQGGYLVGRGLELVGRYQQLDPNTNASEDGLRWTSVGFNYYLREHKLKIQTDYTFRREQGSSTQNDAFQTQLQLDF